MSVQLIRFVFVICSAGVFACGTIGRGGWGMYYANGVVKYTEMNDFLVMNNGDTIQGADLKVKFEKEHSPRFFAQSQGLADKSYKAYQTKWGYSERIPFKPNGCDSCSLFYHLIKKGVIEVYFTETIETTFSGMKSIVTKVPHFFARKKSGEIISFKQIYDIRRMVEENKNAVDEFNKHIEQLKKEDEYQNYRTLMRVIDIYNT